MSNDETRDFPPTPNPHDETLGLDREQRLDQVIAAYLAAVQSGESPDPEPWLQRYPDLAEELREFLANRERVERMARPVRQAVRGGPGVGERVKYIGDYEVLEELGRGGMGVVYKARQVSLNRVVALKMILAGSHAGGDELARFQAEAEAVARLQHPGIVQIHEVGAHEGHPYAALEFVAGGSLAEKLDGTPLPARQAARLVESLAAAVEAAHGRGVVHRDLKPANVLLTEAGEPKVADFGLAKLVAQESGKTSTGGILGTPSYMSPEQGRGDSKRVGPAADVYALGAILYELLTGRPPFKAESPLETVRQVVSEEPVPPRRLVPGVSRDVETITLKCLQKEPGRRYKSAAELAADLRRWQAGEPITARPVGQAERVVKWVKRRPGTAALIAGSGTITLLLALVSTGFAMSNYTHWRALRSAYKQLSDANAELWAATSTARSEAAAARLARAEALGQKEIAEEQNELADAKAAEARDAERNALEAAEKEKKERDRAERLLYGSQLTLAQQYWKEDNAVAAYDVLNSARWDFDGWERRYLATRFYHQGQVTLRGHTGPSWSVTFSPDGHKIASASYDRTVRLWDARTGQELLTLKGHRTPAMSVAFSPDGRKIVSAGGNLGGNGAGEVKVWDARTGKILLDLKGHKDPTWSVAFSPDGRRVVSGGGERSGNRGEIKVWDARSGRKLLELAGHKLAVMRVAVSPDGERIASGSMDCTVKVWDARNGRELLTFRGHENDVMGIAFSADGQRIASTGIDRTVKVWDARTGENLLDLHGHGEGILGVAFSPDGRRIASASDDRTVKVWDARSGDGILTLKGHTANVLAVAFSPDGQRIASGSMDNTVKVWDARTGQQTPTFKGHRDLVTSVAVSPDNQRIASSSYDNTVKVWDVQTGQELLTFRGHTSYVKCAAFSPDGRKIASGGNDKTVKVWDAGTGREYLTFGGHTAEVSSLSFHPDGQRIASGGEDETVKVWDAHTGQELLSLDGHTGQITSVVFSPDGRRIASASFDMTVRVWDAESGEHLFTLQVPIATGLAYSPDGRKIATGSWDYLVNVWDAHGGEKLLTLKGHTKEVHTVAFSPDGDRIVSSGWKELKVWDARRGHELLTIKEDKAFFHSVAFSPDGQWIVSGSGGDYTGEPGVVKVWDAQVRQEAFAFKGHTSPVQNAVFDSAGRYVRSKDKEGKALVWEVNTGREVAALPEGLVWTKSHQRPDGRHRLEADGITVKLIVTHPENPSLREQLSRLAPVPAWHIKQADQAKKESQWFAVGFHLGKLADHSPWDAEARLEEAEAWAEAGQHGRAALAYVRAVITRPNVNSAGGN